MYKILIPNDQVAEFRGGGRYIQTLRENLDSNFVFINKLEEINSNDILIVASFNPFASPLVTKKYCSKQFLIIFDVIPLKFPKHFPVGLKGNLNLIRNRLALKNFDKIITISNSAKTDISKYLAYPIDKISVIYPKLAKIFYSNNNSAVDFENEKYCIYVGDVNWNKNLSNLVKAIKVANVKLLLVGKPFSNDCDIDSLNHPWQKEYQEVMKILKKDDHFKLLGFQTDDELVKLYKNAYLNILISREEGFGYSYMEAASQSCPSLLNNIPVFHETSKEAAFFTDASSHKEIADAISKIYSNESQRDNVAKIAKQRFDDFSRIDIDQEFLKLTQE
jgi:glycosyltransferase involved in cell wall biosynthesis